MMRLLITFVLILTNFSCYCQGFGVICTGDTIRGNHGGYENDDSLTFCAYKISNTSNTLPKRILDINDSIIKNNFGDFFKNNSLSLRDYLLIDNDKFEEVKSNGMGWISLEHCAKEVKYAVRYKIWIYGNIRYFFSIHYDSSFKCLNLSTVSNFCTYFNQCKLMDFCSIKDKAENDFIRKGKVKEVTFSFINNQFVWEFEKDGPPTNKKTLKGHDYILTYNAYTVKLIQRKKRYYQSCEGCPAYFW